ncbi:MAG: competence/damage-inducible protein A [Bacteroidales bacterium]|nr:competence/damage-inducible protein A [Bacteroidales bacterium]
MTVNIINIGDELLIGQVVNTNASVMSRLLTGAGIEVNRIAVVGDNATDIRAALDSAIGSANAVLITGGLGPTKDDITKHLLCEYFGSELVESPVALANVKRIFESRGYELTPINRAQALVPRCCQVLNNDLGTAPAMLFERGGKVVISLPGVPFEMDWLMRNRVLPALKERFDIGTVTTKNILVQGIGESFLSDLIEPWETVLPPTVRLAYLPSAGMVKLRLTHRAADNKPSVDLGSLTQGLYQLAGQYIVGEDCESLAELVHSRFVASGLTLASAESCTGGTIASALTAQAGASAYFKGGIVAYSNEAKENLLGVERATLLAHGAVSEATVRQMAEGARRQLKSDYAVATTGIAGPDGGTPDKPVGTVWVAVATPQTTVAQLLQLGSNRRQQNIDRTVNHVMALLLRLMK